MNFVLKIPNRYISGYDYTSDGIKEINKTLVNFFATNELLSPAFYFHSGWSPDYNVTFDDRTYTTLDDYLEVNDLLWTESIITLKHKFRHNFIRLTSNEKIQIFEIKNKEYLHNPDNFKIWDYDLIPVINKSWIPASDNLIENEESLFIPDKTSVYRRINAFDKISNDFDGYDCCVFFDIVTCGLTHVGTITKVNTDEVDFVTIEQTLHGGNYLNEYLTYKKKYIDLKKLN